MRKDHPLLTSSFYDREDPVLIARELLGAILETEMDGIYTSGVIVETEAYRAPDDLACHARGNRRTPRTETMFGPPGRAYIYKCYGIHDLFNAVTAGEGEAHAILIRAVEPLDNEKVMLQRRNFNKLIPETTNGPGKLTSALGITTALDNTDLTSESSPVRIRSFSVISPEDIVAGPRVGMSHHTRYCGYYPWRFRIKKNRWTSKPDIVKYDW